MLPPVSQDSCARKSVKMSDERGAPLFFILRETVAPELEH